MTKFQLFSTLSQDNLLPKKSFLVAGLLPDKPPTVADKWKVQVSSENNQEEEMVKTLEGTVVLSCKVKDLKFTK